MNGTINYSVHSIWSLVSPKLEIHEASKIGQFAYYTNTKYDISPPPKFTLQIGSTFVFTKINKFNLLLDSCNLVLIILNLCVGEFLFWNLCTCSSDP